MGGELTHCKKNQIKTPLDVGGRTFTKQKIIKMMRPQSDLKEKRLDFASLFLFFAQRYYYF